MGDNNRLDIEESFLQETQEYIEEKHLNEFFDKLLRLLMIHQPEDPIQYMINYLKCPPGLKVVVLCPPNSSHTSMLRALAVALNVEYINVGDLLRTNIRNNCDSECLQYIYEGKLIPDSVTTPIVTDVLLRHSQKGWILDGFPRSRAQAIFLLQNRIIPDRFLNLMEVADKNHFTSFSQSNANPSLRKSRTFEKSVIEVMDVFKQSASSIIVGTDEVQTARKIYAHCGILGSRRLQYPLKCCMIGPSSSGKTTQATLLAELFGAVHIDFGDIQKVVYKKKTLFEDISTEENTHKVLLNRLREADCVTRGWILDGYPNNANQAQLLRKGRIVPHYIFALCFFESEKISKKLGSQILEHKAGLNESFVLTKKDIAAISELFPSVFYRFECPNKSPESISEQIQNEIWKK